MRRKKYEDFLDIEIDKNEPIFPTSVVSKLLDIPRWVLREFDKNKVISPPRRKGEARLYSKKQLSKITYAWYLMQEEGVNMRGIKMILEFTAEDNSKK